MPETSAPPNPADTPAATIWDRFQSTREWLAVMFFFWTLFCLLAGAGVLFAEPSGFVYYLATHLDRAWRTIFILIGVQSALGFGVCQSFFGVHARALVVTFIAGVLWFVAFLLFLSTYPYVGRLDLILIAETAVPSVFLIVPGVSIFFVSYLLWRTNSDR